MKLSPIFFIANLLILLGGCFASEVVAQTSVSFEQLEERVNEVEDSEQALELLSSQASTLAGFSAQEQARFYQLRAIHHERVNLIEEALADYSESIDVLQGQPVNRLLVIGYIERSYMKYLLTNDINVYCPDRKKAAEYARSLNDDDTRAWALSSYVFCFTRPEDFSEGIKVIDEALEIAENNPISFDRKAMIFNGVGAMYRSNQLHDLSYNYMGKALEVWSQKGDIRGVVNMLHNMVGESIESGNWEKAEDHVAQMESLAKTSTENQDFIFFALFNRGHLSLAQQDYARAVDAFSRALDNKDKTEEVYFVRLARLLLAETYARLGQIDSAVAQYELLEDLPPKEDKKAIRSIVLSLKSNDSVQAMTSLFDLVDWNKAQRKIFVSNNTLMRSGQLNEGITSYENKLLENELAIKDLQLSRQQDQQKINRLTQIIISLSAGVLLIVVIWLYRTSRQFKKLAQTDQLTGQYNRGTAISLAEKLFEEARRKRHSLAILVFDLDNFKQINDTLGHDAGDAALKHVADLVGTTLRDGDILGRIGGEEFLVTIYDNTPSVVEAIAERIRAAVEATPVVHEGHEIGLTISIGVRYTEYGELTAAMTVQQLIKHADVAMYQAKNSGRNRIVYYELETG